MRFLLDTHVFLWCITDDRQLKKDARQKIIEATDVYVSAASIWELTIKIKLKKLNAKLDQIVAAIEKSGFHELPITAQHAVATSRLPDIHEDPFDRILIAQALSEPLIFLTADAVLKKYSEIVELIV